MNETIIHTIIKIFFINLFIILINFKVINYKFKSIDILKGIVASVIITAFYIMINKYIDKVLMIFIMYVLQLIFLKLMKEDNNNNQTFVTNLIANAITYILFEVSMIIESVFIIKFHLHNIIANIILILIIEAIILALFFKIKRFRKGFIFLKDKVKHDYIDMIMINISAIIILAYYLTGNYYENMTKQLIICFILLGIIMLIMIQKTLTLYYKQRLLARNIEDYQNEIAEKDKQIEKLSNEKYEISKLNHEFYNRQKALEKKVQDFVANANTETASELSVIESINNLSKEYSGKLENIKTLDKLPETGIEEIDDMFKYMQTECKKYNIEFKLQVNGNIHHMINKLIPQNKLVTLIGDHIRDAIIAIENSANKFKSIIAIIGTNDKYYEFCVYDTGIEFEIETLLKLGLEPATTHKDTGGSGIGFMTTFETMKGTKASLIIDEKNKMTENDYTKSVTIRFDNKNEYRIKSYRAGEIKKKCKDNRIIIIENEEKL